MFLFHKQQIMICIVAVVMGVVFVFGRFIPLRSRAEAVEQQTSARTQAISRGSTDAARCISLRNQLQQSLARVEQYQAGIPDERALGTFLSEMADLMNKHQLKDQVVAPSQEVKSDDITCIPITMQGVGSFSSVFAFFVDLNSLDRFIRIDKVKIENGDTLDGSVTMETNAVVFYRNSDSDKEDSI